MQQIPTIQVAERTLNLIYLALTDSDIDLGEDDIQISQFKLGPAG